MKSSKLRQPEQPGVSYRGHADAEGEAVRVHAVVSGVGVALACARVDVHVNVHEAGSDVQSRNVNRFQCRRRIEMVGHSRDAAIQDRHIPDGANVVLGVDHMSALEEQVVLGLPIHERRHKRHGK